MPEIKRFPASFYSLLQMMKYIRLLLFLSLFTACRNNSRPEELLSYEQDSMRIEKITIAFGEVYDGEVAIDTVHIQNISGKPWEGCFNYEVQFIKVKVVPYRLEPGEKGMIVVEFDTRLYGKYNDYIGRLQCRNRVGSEGYWSFIVTARVKEDFRGLTPEERQEAPVIKVDSARYDFGTVEAGEPVKRSFYIENTGKKDLIIRNIATSCGCTVAQLESRIIRSGETGELKVNFRTSGRTGHQHKTITLTTNDYRRPQYDLVIEGEVVKKR